MQQLCSPWSVLALGVVLGLSGCNQTPTNPSLPDFAVSVTVLPQVADAQTLDFEIHLVNNTKHSQALSFNPSIAFAPQILDALGRVVWQRHDTYDLTIKWPPVVVGSGQQLSLRYSWNIHDSNGHPVSPGTYRVQGFFFAAEGILAAGDQPTFVVSSRP
jgi:hypothetical protein